HEAAGAGQYLRRRGAAGAGLGVRHLPGAPVCAQHPGRAAGGRAHRRGGRAAHLLPDRSAAAQACAGHAGGVHLPRGLERLHVAADRADRAGALHAAGVAGGPVPRAHHGRGADDGRCRGHGGAGAVAVPAAAKVLHPGSAARERERLMAIASHGSPASAHGARKGMLARAAVRLLLALVASAAAKAHAQDAAGPGLLDGFEDASKWRVVASNQVSGGIRQVEGAEGRALCLDYDFNGVSGYAGIQRELPLEYPENYRFTFRLRGESPDNDLQFKLVDASGDNVWWVNRPRYHFPKAWTEVAYRRRHIGKAWGPDPDPVLRSSRKIEFTIYNNAGGRGSVCFDSLVFEELPPDDGSPPVPVSAMSTVPASDAMAAADGNMETAWAAPAGPQRIVFDLGRAREFGGVRLRWKPGRHATRYAVSLSSDGSTWRTGREVTRGNGGDDWIALPEAEARYIALDLQTGS